MKKTILMIAVGVLLLTGCSYLSVNTDSRAPNKISKEYEGAYFSIQPPKDFKLLPTENYDYAAFESPDGNAVFAVYSPLWTGEGTEIMLQEDEIEVKREVKKSIMEESELGQNANKIDTYITFEAKDKRYIRSIVDIIYEKEDSQTQRVFSYQYKDQASYNQYLEDYLSFKNSLVQFAD